MAEASLARVDKETPAPILSRTRSASPSLLHFPISSHLHHPLSELTLLVTTTPTTTTTTKTRALTMAGLNKVTSQPLLTPSPDITVNDVTVDDSAIAAGAKSTGGGLKRPTFDSLLSPVQYGSGNLLASPKGGSRRSSVISAIYVSDGNHNLLQFPAMAEWVRLYLEKRQAKYDKLFGDTGFDLAEPLPKLPVPDLKRSMHRYWETIRPLLSDEQRAYTRKCIDDFLASKESEKAQRALVEKSEREDNWSYRWWMEDMYLRIPLSLPINICPGMVLPCENYDSPDDRLKFAAKFVTGVLGFVQALTDKSLPVDRVSHSKRGQPLCMEQYYRLFSCYRQPGLPMDIQHTTTNSSADPALHVIVAYRGRFFKVPVRSSEGDDWLTAEELFTLFARLTTGADASASDGHAEMGRFTALPRDVWAGYYDHLQSDSRNRAALETIASSLFLVCLDDADPTADMSSTALLKRSIYGGADNARNRWFDKTCQYLFAADGHWGLCYEHSVAEGVAVIGLLESFHEYVDYVRTLPLECVDDQSAADLPVAEELVWNVDDKVEEGLKQAREYMAKEQSNLDVLVTHFADYGREYIKSSGNSPDSWVQIALQLAHFRAHGKLVSTYESASTRRFRCGRVDNIRACSMAALDFCRAMCDADDTVADDDKRRLLKDSMNYQVAFQNETITGDGLDNHLLGLRLTCESMEGPTPTIFSDPAFELAHHFSLSTSQVTTSRDSFMGYGPVVPDGYGCSYNLRRDAVLFCTTSFLDCDATSTRKFETELIRALRDMRALVERN